MFQKKDQIAMKKLLFRVSHYIKRRIQRWLIDSKRKLSDTHMYPKSDFETAVFGICRRLVIDAESELWLCPNTGNRFLKNDTEHIDVIIKQNLVEVILNRSVPITVMLNDRMYRRIVILFDNNVEMRRKALETDIKSAIKEKLEDIYEHLKQKTEV